MTVLKVELYYGPHDGRIIVADDSEIFPGLLLDVPRTRRDSSQDGYREYYTDTYQIKKLVEHGRYRAEYFDTMEA
jgi:hypothetical protein